MNHWLKLVSPITALVLMVLVLSSTSAGEVTNAAPRSVAALRDGSRIVGELLPKEISIESSALGPIRIGASRVRLIEFAKDNTNRTVIHLVNGDKLQGTVTLPALGIRTVFGEVSLRLPDIVSLQLSAPGAVADGLVLSLTFDAVDGTTVPDSSPSGLAARLVGAEVVPNGRSGSACQLDGNIQHVVVADAAALRLAGPGLSVAAWVKIDPDVTFENDAQPQIIAKGARWSAAYADYALGLREHSGVLRFEYKDEQGQPFYVIGTTPLHDGKWHHVAATFDEGKIVIFVDGQPEGAQTGPTSRIQVTSEPLYIGCRYQKPQRGPLKGLIDDVRLYNRALTNTEVIDLAR